MDPLPVDRAYRTVCGLALETATRSPRATLALCAARRGLSSENARAVAAYLPDSACAPLRVDRDGRARLVVTVGAARAYAHGGRGAAVVPVGFGTLRQDGVDERAARFEPALVAPPTLVPLRRGFCVELPTAPPVDVQVGASPAASCRRVFDRLRRRGAAPVRMVFSVRLFALGGARDMDSAWVQLFALSPLAVAGAAREAPVGTATFETTGARSALTTCSARLLAVPPTAAPLGCPVACWRGALDRLWRPSRVPPPAAKRPRP